MCNRIVIIISPEKEERTVIVDRKAPLDCPERLELKVPTADKDP
jgi:hypothetical protein